MTRFSIILQQLNSCYNSVGLIYKHWHLKCWRTFAKQTVDTDLSISNSLYCSSVLQAYHQWPMIHITFSRAWFFKWPFTRRQCKTWDDGNPHSRFKILKKKYNLRTSHRKDFFMIVEHLIKKCEPSFALHLMLGFSPIQTQEVRQPAFRFIPKVVQVWALCRPVRIFHTRLSKSFLDAPQVIVKLKLNGSCLSMRLHSCMIDFLHRCI